MECVGKHLWLFSSFWTHESPTLCPVHKHLVASMNSPQSQTGNQKQQQAVYISQFHREMLFVSGFSVGVSQAAAEGFLSHHPPCFALL